jgi:putative transposase
MWKAGLEEYDEVKGLEWKWQAVDGAITKAPLGGQATGANPTDRAKRGTKRSLLVEAKGIPLAIEVGPASRHDVRMLQATLDGVVIERPEPDEKKKQN